MSDVSADVADPPADPVPPKAEQAAPVETASSEAASADTTSAETTPVAPPPVESATSESGTTASASAAAESSGAAESASTNGAGPTDDQHAWLSAFCGIDTRAAGDAISNSPSMVGGAGGAAVLSDVTASAQDATHAKAATPELGVFDKAKMALQVAGEVTGVSGVIRSVEDKASAAVDTAEKMGSIVAEHPLDAAAGLGYGALQGVTPGGFVLPSPDPNSQAFELGRGVGMMAGGVGAIAMGAGEETVGIGADATGVGALVGVPLNILGAVTAASGVTAEVAGAATIANAMSMGGGDDPPAKGDRGRKREKGPEEQREQISRQQRVIAKQRADIDKLEEELANEQVKPSPNAKRIQELEKQIDALRKKLRIIDSTGKSDQNADPNRTRNRPEGGDEDD